MSKAGRVGNIIIGALMILLSIMLIRLPFAGFLVVMLIIAFTLIIYGIRCLVYYFTMARYMVGGLYALILGILGLDFGIFTGTLIQVPKVYIILYLAITYIIVGTVSLLRGLEAKKYGAPYWKGKIIYGVINILVVLVCLIFFRSERVLVTIYAIGLIYSAVRRILSAFQKTEIVYVQ